MPHVSPDELRSLNLPPLVRRGDSVLSRSSIARHSAAGSLIGVLPGTLLRADLVNDQQWRAAAVAAWRPDAVLTDEIAAALTFWRELAVSTIDVACETTVKRPGYRFHRRTIPPDLVVYRGSSRLVHPALSAIDLAVATGGASIDNVLRSKMARIEDLWAALEVTRYRRGNSDRRRLLLESRAEPWSFAERRAHVILRDAGIEGWRANLPIVLAGQRYFLDIAFPDLKLVLEIDGREYHTASDVFESDRERQNALVVDRWIVLRFTYRMLVERPDYVLATVRAGMRLARDWPIHLRGVQKSTLDRSATGCTPSI